MIQISDIQDLFEKVRTETVLANLYERKMSVQQQLAEVHKQVHAINEDRGNMHIPGMTKTDLLAIVNTGNTLIEFIDDCIHDLRALQIEEKKEARIKRAQERDANGKKGHRDYAEKTRFHLAAKKMLSRDTFDAIWNIAKSSTQEQIIAMPERVMA